jgi:hypothetical protein
MTLKIERVMQPGVTLWKLSGRIDAENTVELRELLKPATDGQDRVIDLEEIRLADQMPSSFWQLVR